jgi:hypothetical protein
MEFNILIKIHNIEDGKGDFLRAVVMESGQHVGVESRGFIRDSKEEFRNALDIFYTNLGHVLRKRQFPEHTQIADHETTSDGGLRVFNLRYPDEQISSPIQGE